MKNVFLLAILTLTVSCLKNKKSLPIGGQIQDSFEITRERTPDLQLRARKVKDLSFLYYDKNNHAREVRLSSENTFRDVKRDHVLNLIKKNRNLELPFEFDYAYGLTDFSLEEILSIKTLKDFTMGEKKGRLRLELTLMSSDQQLSKIDYSIGYFDESQFIEIYKAAEPIAFIKEKEELLLNLNLTELEDEKLRQMLLNEESLVFMVNNFNYKKGDKLVSLESEKKRLSQEYARLITSTKVKTEIVYTNVNPGFDLASQVTNILDDQALLKGENYYLYNVEEDDYEHMKKKSSLLFQGSMSEKNLELPASYESGEMIVYFQVRKYQEVLANRQITVHVFGTKCYKSDYAPEYRGTICNKIEKGPCTVFENYKKEIEAEASLEDNPFIMNKNEDFVFTKLGIDSGKITFTYNAKSNFELIKKDLSPIAQVTLGFTHHGSCMNYANDKNFAYKDYSPAKVTSNLQAREVYDLIIFHQGLD